MILLHLYYLIHIPSENKVLHTWVFGPRGEEDSR